MSESSAPSNDYRFESREFLGYQPTSPHFTPTLMMADVTGTLWRLLCAHWLTIAATSVFGGLLPYVVLEHVFNIKTVDLGQDIFKADFYSEANFYSIFWSLAVSAWVSLALAFLTKHILSLELALSIDWQRTLLTIVPILALSAILHLGITLGTLLLFIPGVIFYLATILALPIFLIENKSIRNAIQQSFERTRGFRVKIFWVSVGFYILGAVLMFASTSLVQALGQVAEQTMSFMEIFAYLGRMGVVLDALFAAAVYISIRKLLHGDEPDKLASVFD